jgi:dolichol-phosphate mannosyltransferase
MKVSVILPTYHERDNIGDLLSAIESVMQPQSWHTQILVVDDNSDDGTEEIVQDFSTKTGMEVKCIVRKQERGLATAILHGIKISSGDVIVVMDTDFNHDPKIIPQLVKLLEFYDLVIGSRFVMGGGMEDRRRYYYSQFYNIFVRAMLRLQVQDNLSGFYAIRRDKLLVMDLEGIYRGYGEYFIRLLLDAWLRKYRMLEIPVFYILRRHGQSKSRFMSMLRDYTLCVFSMIPSRLRWKFSGYVLPANINSNSNENLQKRSLD